MLQMHNQKEKPQDKQNAENQRKKKEPYTVNKALVIYKLCCKSLAAKQAAKEVTDA